MDGERQGVNVPCRVISARGHHGHGQRSSGKARIRKRESGRGTDAGFRRRKCTGGVVVGAAQSDGAVEPTDRVDADCKLGRLLVEPDRGWIGTSLQKKFG